MVGETDDMPDRWTSHAGPPARRHHLVMLENIEPVGLALALSLLRSGYGVLGGNVSAACLTAFEAAGGTPVAATKDDVAWSIQCHETRGIRPETLSRLSSARNEYGRPRLELSGPNRGVGGHPRDAVATLEIGPGRNPKTALHVALDVSSKGVQLVVRGERSLFESALPVLTVLADRVLYAGSEQDSDEHESSETSSRNHPA